MRLRRFTRQAKGQGRAGQGQKREPCPPGDPNCKPDDSQSGDDQEGQGQGQGQGKGEGEVFTIGPGGQKILMLSKGGQGQGEGEGQGQGQSGEQPGGCLPGCHGRYCNNRILRDKSLRGRGVQFSYTQ